MDLAEAMHDSGSLVAGALQVPGGGRKVLDSKLASDCGGRADGSRLLPVCGIMVDGTRPVPICAGLEGGMRPVPGGRTVCILQVWHLPTKPVAKLQLHKIGGSRAAYISECPEPQNSSGIS